MPNAARAAGCTVFSSQLASAAAIGTRSGERNVGGTEFELINCQPAAADFEWLLGGSRRRHFAQDDVALAYHRGWHGSIAAQQDAEKKKTRQTKRKAPKRKQRPRHEPDDDDYGRATASAPFGRGPAYGYAERPRFFLFGGGFN